MQKVPGYSPPHQLLLNFLQYKRDNQSNCNIYFFQVFPLGLFISNETHSVVIINRIVTLFEVLVIFG